MLKPEERQSQSLGSNEVQRAWRSWAALSVRSSEGICRIQISAQSPVGGRNWQVRAVGVRERGMSRLGSGVSAQGISRTLPPTVQVGNSKGCSGVSLPE